MTVKELRDYLKDMPDSAVVQIGWNVYDVDEERTYEGQNSDNDVEIEPLADGFSITGVYISQKEPE